MTRPFDYVAFADTLNAKADTLSIYPSAYPDATAKRLYEAGEAEAARRRLALCSAPTCGFCGWLKPNHDARCVEVK